jgi:hypothetical protein
MHEDTKTVCPDCLNDGLVKLISAGGAVIVAGREMNQYNDVKAARYWRDKNGVRHPVTAADGYVGSATVERKQTASPEQVKQRKQRDQKAAKDDRLKLQKDRANAWTREQLKKT